MLTSFVAAVQRMDDGCDVMEPGISPGTLPTSYVNNGTDVDETNSGSQPEEYIIDPLVNLPAETSAAVGSEDDNDKRGTAQEWLAVVKREPSMKEKEDGDKGDEDEEVGTSSFENLSPLSDDMQGSFKGFRKVLGISYIYLEQHVHTRVHTHTHTHTHIYIHFMT